MKYHTPWLADLTERSEPRKIVLKAHLIVWGGNLAYLVFACLLQIQMC